MGREMEIIFFNCRNFLQYAIIFIGHRINEVHKFFTVNNHIC